MTAASTLNLATGTWNLDTAHTAVGFSVRHMMVSKVKGTFQKFEGAITVADEIEDSHVEVSIDVSSVDTGNAQRDGHLRTTDFFDIEKHNTITFASTGVASKGADWVVTGDLTINGITKPVDLTVEFGGVAGEVAGFEATTIVSRADFDVNFQIPMENGGVVIGDKVTINLDVEAKLETVSAEA